MTGSKLSEEYFRDFLPLFQHNNVTVPSLGSVFPTLTAYLRFSDVVTESAAPVPLGKLLEKKILQAHPKSAQSETPQIGPPNL